MEKALYGQIPIYKRKRKENYLRICEQRNSIRTILKSFAYKFF